MADHPTTFRGASRARSCESKRSHQTSGDARAAMKAMIRAGRVIGEARVYHCRFCGLWHWGVVDGSHERRRVQTIAAIEKAVARDRELREGSRHG
ncbi:hypothetical protein EBL87_09155 [Cereibacter sphaeroides]|uniref:hypothetical protein n=1 Tax=Cereibacter sphaeroides TaxID=1063 RepID=UPI000F542ED0|nr:hypothetical protein [Cereibacter sphaeroides]AZB63896.1 hypothetical protein EBL87_09155 [Cereibacter sphaeroides]AZB68182.1 hypothetical protein EBL86_07315 [Cereibacter sphaeroides]